jgi:predicted ATPase/DNA-binding SARP family transcriptional activator
MGRMMGYGRRPGAWHKYPSLVRNTPPARGADVGLCRAKVLPVVVEQLRVEVLGPIRVRDGAGHNLTPSGVLQRRLLALLVLRRDRIVHADEAIDALWPEQSPRDPAAALQNQVFRLRRRLPDGVIESTGDGYRLVSVHVGVDVDAVADAVSAADRGPATLTALDSLLDRWNGPAYPELVDVDDGRAEAVRLEELRVRALEVRAECRLAAGDVDGVVPELARLVAEHPLRERPRSMLMTALERAGRRVEALRAYDDFRRLLGDELGIEPSPALTEQHAALLAGTPVAPAATPEPSVPAAPLPVPPTSLVGRDELVDQVLATVAAHRVVTLVGPAGVGKTRLALEVGHRLAGADSGRPVVLCELATATDSSAVELVAAALAVDPRAGTDLADRVAEGLDTAALVLLLDGCEHVLDPMAALVERIVARCPSVHVLVTSQERLRVPGERVVRVPPLSHDGGGAATQLFVDRARAAWPEFDPEPDELATVAEIARRLDGLPLAIELAAARLHTSDLGELVAGLDARFALLASGYRTSTRHGSLRAAVSWSYDLLDERLRRTFVDVSVFAAPFTTSDAAAVCGTDHARAADDLARLVERSLVGRAGGGRYAMLETLRAFATEQLTLDGREATVRQRHAQHQVALVEAAHRNRLTGDRDALAALDAAILDLRAALDWSLEVGRVDLAARVVVALRDYGIFRQRPDVLAWAGRVAAAGLDDLDASVAASLCAVAAYASWMAGDVAGSASWTEQGRSLGERAGRLPSVVAMMCGNHALFDGRLGDAVEWYRRGVDIATAEGDAMQRQFAAATQLLPLAYAGDPSAAERASALLDEVDDAETPAAAYAWYCAGESVLGVDDELARSRFGRALALAERTGAMFVVGVAGASAASIDARTGDADSAAEAYRWLIPHWRRSGVWSTQWTMLRSIAVLLNRLGKHRDAALLEGAVRATAAGHRIYGADEVTLHELGARLRTELGGTEYGAARAEGARLDGNAATDHALRALA